MTLHIELIHEQNIKLREQLANACECIDQLLPGFEYTTANLALINDTLIASKLLIGSAVGDIDTIRGMIQLKKERES